MFHRSLPLVAAGLLLAACATTSTSPTPPSSRTEGAIDVFEMHPDPLVETRTGFWDGKVRSGYLQGPPQGAYGRVSMWLERSALRNEVHGRRFSGGAWQELAGSASTGGVSRSPG